jgi:hypothetical protein
VGIGSGPVCEYAADLMGILVTDTFLRFMLRRLLQACSSQIPTFGPGAWQPALPLGEILGERVSPPPDNSGFKT